MDKREALKTLIQATDLSNEQKEELISMLPDMTDEEVAELGKKMAMQMTHSAEAAEKAIEAIDEMIEQVEKTEQEA